MRPPMMRPIAASARVEFPRVRRHWATLGTFLLVNFLVLLLGSAIALSTAGTLWYASLEKPMWAPRPQVFTMAWTALYAMMAVGAWWVSRARPVSANRPALNLYAVTVLLNALWLPIFFGLQNPALAFLDALALLLALASATYAFSRRRRAAAVLLVPALAWTAFAAVLAYQLWRMNP